MLRLTLFFFFALMQSRLIEITWTKWFHNGNQMTPHWKNKPGVSAFIKSTFFSFFFSLLNQLKIVWLILNRLMCVELNYQFSGNGDISIKEKNK